MLFLLFVSWHGLCACCLRNTGDVHAVISSCDILTDGKARRLHRAIDSFISSMRSTGIEGIEVDLCWPWWVWCTFNHYLCLRGEFWISWFNVVEVAFPLNWEITAVILQCRVEWCFYFGKWFSFSFLLSAPLQCCLIFIIKPKHVLIAEISAITFTQFSLWTTI